MKILVVVTGGLKNDGISLGTIGYFREMNKDDMQVDFLAVNEVDDKITNKIIEAGCNVIKSTGRNGNIIKYGYELFKTIRKNKYDIVHAHGSSSLLVIEMFVAKLAGVKSRIAHSRNTICNNEKVDRILRPLFYKVTTDYFACGYDAGKWLFENNEFTVIPNGKNVELFMFSEEKREKIRSLYTIGNKLAICHVGRFNYQKNHEFLLDIFYQIKNMDNNVCLVLIGDGELKDSINKKILELGIQDDVIMVGEVSNINEFMQGMDIMVMPSRYEGLPNVVIEAQISGLQCMISDKITEECKITDLVQFESIEKGPKIWAERMLKTNFTDRESSKKETINQVRVAGYDIEVNAENLKNKYVSLCNKNV